MEVEKFATAYAKFYESLSPKTAMEEYGAFFDAHSAFSDPFQTVEGLEAIHKIFVDMYKKLHKPRFIVDEVLTSNQVAYLHWRFYYSLAPNAEAQSFSGVSRVMFSPSGKVKSHVDYWDAAANVYEKIPLLGFFMRLIKRRLHAK